MTIEQSYREECDTIRLLIEEFRQVSAEYFVRNADAINAIEAHDVNLYVKPKAVPNIFGFLAGSLLVHCISLLEFRLPTIVILLLRSASRVKPSDIQSFKNGNVIDWMEKVIDRTDDAVFDFSDPLVERVRAWIRVRNDEVHYGGYRSERTEQRQIDILDGVNVGGKGSLYDIQFVACENAITDIEAFFKMTEVSLKVS